jgi:NADH:ubiquinone oxidoreductase subunit 6 (subunit J)
VALFYLMLNAPFLAMIQVTVYAGAIMVLFMFVIMLLGSEKLGATQGPYRWLAPAAVGLTTLFLVVAFYVVVRSNVGLLAPVAPQPQLRVAHAVAGVPEVDIYLNDVKALNSVGYHETSAFGKVLPGDYIVKLYHACEEADQTKCVDPIAANEKPLLEQRISVASDTATTYVASGTADAAKLLSVPTDISVVPDDRTARIMAANMSSQTVSLVRIPQANRNSPLINAATNKPIYELLAADIAPGAATEAIALGSGSYDLVWITGPADQPQRMLSLPDYAIRPKTNNLFVLVQEPAAEGTTGRLDTVKVTPAAVNEEFGSPQQIGVSLLSTFLLPFELVSLLLLAAMVGAIILTREEYTKRVRERVSMTAAASRINRAATQAQQSESSAD